MNAIDNQDRVRSPLFAGLKNALLSSPIPAIGNSKRAANIVNYGLVTSVDATCPEQKRSLGERTNRLQTGQQTNLVMFHSAGCPDSL